MKKTIALMPLIFLVSIGSLNAMRRVAIRKMYERENGKRQDFYSNKYKNKVSQRISKISKKPSITKNLHEPKKGSNTTWSYSVGKKELSTVLFLAIIFGNILGSHKVICKKDRHPMEEFYFGPCPNGCGSKESENSGETAEPAEPVEPAEK